MIIKPSILISVNPEKHAFSNLDTNNEICFLKRVVM
jgi:hypothetical protein